MGEAYSDWREQNEERLKEEYFNYLNNSKGHDIYEYIFFWEWADFPAGKKVERMLAFAKRAEQAWEDWCQAIYEEEMENANDAAIEDDADRRADR